MTPERRSQFDVFCRQALEFLEAAGWVEVLRKGGG